MDPKKIDPRIYFSDNELAILNDASSFLYDMANGRLEDKVNILQTGRYSGKTGTRDIGQLIDLLHRYSTVADPDNVFVRRYRSVVGRFVPGRKTNWSQLQHPLEDLAQEIWVRYPSFRNRLSFTVADTSPVVDPQEELHRQQEQLYRQQLQASQPEADFGAYAAGFMPKAKKPNTPQIEKENEETLEESLTKAERNADLLMQLRTGEDEAGQPLSDIKRKEIMNQLGYDKLFSEEEFNFIFANPGVLVILSPEQFQEDEAAGIPWETRVREAIEKKKQAGNQPATADPAASPSVLPTSSAPVVTRRIKPTPLSGLKKVGEKASGLFNRMKKAPTTTPTNPITSSTLIGAQKISTGAQGVVTHGAQVAGSKIREIVRRHPESTTTIATGIAGGLLGSVFRVPFPVGFVGGAAAAQMVMRVANRGRQEPSGAVMMTQTVEDPSQEQPSADEEAVNEIVPPTPNDSAGGNGRRSFSLVRYLMNRPVLLTLLFLVGGTFLFVLVYQFSVFPPFQRFDAQVPNTANNNLQIKKSGPVSVENYKVGDKITYTITATYLGTGVGTVDITDALPENTRYITSNPEGSVLGRNVKWKFENIAPATTQSISLEIEVTADITDSWVINSVAGVAQSSSLGGSNRGGSCPSAEAIAENKRDPNTCKYLNPGFDVHNLDIPNTDIEAYIKKYSPKFIQAGKGDEAEFRRRVALTIQKAQQVGLNPIIILGFWKTESGFSTAGRYDHGCKLSWVNSFETSLNCAVGLSADGSRAGGSISARCTASKISQADKDAACKLAKGIRDAHPDKYASNPVTFPITTIDDYMENYGSRAPNLGDADVNRNCTHSYNLMLETIVEFNACGGTTTSGGNSSGDRTTTNGSPTQCTNVGEPIALGYTKKLLPLPAENNCNATRTGSCGRPGTCIKPAKIVIHTTNGPGEEEETYLFFANGASGAGTGTQFVVGKSGRVIQMAELFKDQVETTRGVLNYSDHISIEVTNPKDYASKDEVPAAQYTALVKLIKQLMQQYNIPLGDLQYDWKSPNNEKNMSIGPGVYGHYQLNPKSKSDPGIGFFRDLRKDLQ